MEIRRTRLQPQAISTRPDENELDLFEDIDIVDDA